jgi:pyruvate dehydrogenase E2 component (dihydrolipoamide acetyltransferase)
MFARNRQKAAQVSAPPVTAQPPTAPALAMTAAQRVTAQRMAESKQSIPHYYLQTSANAEPMLAQRSAHGEKLAWDAFFVYAAGKALKKYERMRRSFVDGQLVPQDVDAVGVAVDLDGDLYVVRAANPAQKTPEEISTEIRAWVQRLRDGDPEARKLGRANLTISNLGATGIEAFTAVINPPEAAILAVGKVGPVVAVVDGQAVVQNRVSLTLSVDHRVVNGRYAAEFLQAIVNELESL